MANLEVIKRLAQVEESGGSGVLIKVIASQGHAPARPGSRLLLVSTGEKLGTVGGGSLEKQCLELAQEVAVTGKSRVVQYSLDENRKLYEGVPTGMVCGGSVQVFFEPVGFRDRVVIFGAGHVGRAVAYHLSPLDFVVSLYDDRQEMIDSMPKYEKVTSECISYNEVSKYIKNEDFIIISSYSHALDYQLMKAVLKEHPSPRYLGVIASRKKREEFFKGLDDELSGGYEKHRIYMPCGLNVGTGKPHEIAVAVTAEVLAVKQDLGAVISLKDK
ncbi:MAG: XdhC family protein [Spirochaetia bacterium]